MLVVLKTWSTSYYVKGAGLDIGWSWCFEDGLLDILTWPMGPFHNGVTAENVAENTMLLEKIKTNFVIKSK